jgi:tetratricopeptide (TPR) repeat protein
MYRLKWTKKEILEAIDYFRKAIELDPEFAQGWAETAGCYAIPRINFWSADFDGETAEAERFARHALALDKTDARVLATAGYTLAHPVGHIEEGSALLDLAIEFNPNFFQAWMGRGWTGLMLGEVDAFKYFERSLRLNPLDPFVFMVEAGMAHAHFLACHYDDAITWATKSLQRVPTYVAALNALVVSHAMAGNIDEAARLWNFRPQTLKDLRLSRLAEWWPAKSEVLKTYTAAFRLIGVAE